MPKFFKTFCEKPKPYQSNTVVSNLNSFPENASQFGTPPTLDSNNFIMSAIQQLISTIDQQSELKIERQHLAIIKYLNEAKYPVSLAQVHQLSYTNLSYYQIASSLKIDRGTFPPLLAQKTYEDDIPLYLNKLKTISLKAAIERWGLGYYQPLKSLKRRMGRKYRPLNDYSFKALHVCIKDNTITDVAAILGLHHRASFETKLTKYKIFCIELRLLEEAEIKKIIGDQYFEKLISISSVDLSIATLGKIFKIIHHHEDVNNNIEKYRADFSNFDVNWYLSQFTYRDKVIDQNLLAELELFDESAVKRINFSYQSLPTKIVNIAPKCPVPRNGNENSPIRITFPLSDVESTLDIEQSNTGVVNSLNQIVKNFIPTLTSEEIVKCSSNILNYLNQVKSGEMNTASINQTTTCLDNSLPITEATNDDNTIPNIYKDNGNFLFFSPESPSCTDKPLENEDNSLFEDEFDSSHGFFP